MLYVIGVNLAYNVIWPVIGVLKSNKLIVSGSVYQPLNTSPGIDGSSGSVTRLLYSTSTEGTEVKVDCVLNVTV